LQARFWDVAREGLTAGLTEQNFAPRWQVIATYDPKNPTKENTGVECRLLVEKPILAVALEEKVSASS